METYYIYKSENITSSNFDTKEKAINNAKQRGLEIFIIYKVELKELETYKKKII